MKKQLFLFLALLVAVAGFSQKVTVTATYYKVKIGARNALKQGMAAHLAKYRPAGSEYAIRVLNVTGGEHNGELLVLANSGVSFKQRDDLKPQPDEMYDDWAKNVSPHLEAMTGGDILIYRKDYSSKLGTLTSTAEKSVSTCYSLIPSKMGKEFWDIVKKLPKVFDRMGANTAAYIAYTGSDRLCYTNRYINGWAELDNDSILKKSYDEEYGAGSYDKDVATFFSSVEKKSTVMLRLNKDLSSK